MQLLHLQNKAQEHSYKPGSIHKTLYSYNYSNLFLKFSKEAS